MLLVDTIKGKVIDDDELKESYARRQPYGEWLDQQFDRVKRFKNTESENCKHISKEELGRLQKAFGYSYEDVKTSILNMAKNGAESIGAMGIDSPLAVLV